jgi:hypothetical protein
MLKDKLLIFLINNLLLYIPLLALTDGQTHRRRDESILVGLGNLQFLQVILVGLGNLWFFQVDPGWAG